MHKYERSIWIDRCVLSTMSKEKLQGSFFHNLHVDSLFTAVFFVYPPSPAFQEKLKKVTFFAYYILCFHFPLSIIHFFKSRFLATLLMHSSNNRRHHVLMVLKTVSGQMEPDESETIPQYCTLTKTNLVHVFGRRGNKGLADFQC